MHEKPSRQSRKLDHLRHALELEDGPCATGFADVRLIHNCLPEVAWNDVSLDSRMLGWEMAQPILLNAITGGATDVQEVNGLLASFASAAKLPMAVGSQYAAIVDDSFIESYRVVRRNNPDGIIIANLGAHADVKQAKAAVAMLGAQALQIHLNPAQELLMSEGDRDFRSYLSNISKIAAAVEVPVIVKEVGFGMAREQVRFLLESGIKAIDVGGAGGTNFAAIEAGRQDERPHDDLISWGIPTVISAVETIETVAGRLPVIVSGGVRTPLDAVKALMLGADSVAMATPFLRRLFNAGLEETLQAFERFCHDMKTIMLLSGANSIAELKKRPILIGGESADWLTRRGFCLDKYANRDILALD